MAATNRAFRAEPNNEHAYDHIQLFSRQSSGAPAANLAYRDDNRPNRPQQAVENIVNIAIGQRTLFAMIALFALSVLVAVATLILTITISMSVKDRTEGASNVKGDF